MFLSENNNGCSYCSPYHIFDWLLEESRELGWVLAHLWRQTRLSTLMHLECTSAKDRRDVKDIMSPSFSEGDFWANQNIHRVFILNVAKGIWMFLSITSCNNWQYWLSGVPVGMVLNSQSIQISVPLVKRRLRRPLSLFLNFHGFPQLRSNFLCDSGVTMAAYVVAACSNILSWVTMNPRFWWTVTQAINLKRICKPALEVLLFAAKLPKT